jgi:LPXTG-motif cell wall-anchored protein
MDTTPPKPIDPATSFKNGINERSIGDKTDLVFIIETALPAILPTVSVDGSALAASQYTISSGSVVVTLLADYLDTLSVGTHTLLVEFDDGTRASGTFSIQAASGDNGGTTGGAGGTQTDGGSDSGSGKTALPTTGDDSWMLILPLLLMVLGALALLRKRAIK